jgi:hypothetical protein
LEKYTEEIQKRDAQLVALTKDLLKAKSAKPNKSVENNQTINKDLQSTIGKLNLQIS